MDLTKSRRRGKLERLIHLSLFALFLVLLIRMPFVQSGPGANNKNYSVRTTVNITDAMPEIMNVSCNGGSAITLQAGSTKRVSCLVMIKDFNGGNTIDGENGTVRANFYFSQNKSSDPDDGNEHYTNSSCSMNGTPNGYFVNYTCDFPVWYYALNGTWRINTTVWDNHSGYGFNVSGIFNTTISALYALNVTNEINYGDMYVGEISQSSIEANVTNFGNMNINVTVYGFGGENETTAAKTLAMICGARNLTIANERYALSSGIAWGSMTTLSGSATLISGLQIAQQLDDATPMVNSTYWRLQVNASENPWGQCNGTVVFSAEAP